MACTFLRSYNEVFSREKRNAVYIVLAGVYACRECHQIHKLKYEEETNHEQTEKS